MKFNKRKYLLSFRKQSLHMPPGCYMFAGSLFASPLIINSSLAKA